jgi:hypothetical protein
MRGVKIWDLFLSMILLMVGAVPLTLAAEPPHYGGVLRVALAADPPSLDMHQESTFAVAQPMSALDNTLVVFDPHTTTPRSLVTWPNRGQFLTIT